MNYFTCAFTFTARSLYSEEDLFSYSTFHILFNLTETCVCDMSIK